MSYKSEFLRERDYWGFIHQGTDLKRLTKSISGKYYGYNGFDQLQPAACANGAYDSYYVGLFNVPDTNL